jgi:chemotaxis protein MotB
MILLAFFILLNTLSKVDERRKRLALGSLVGSFGILPDGTGMYDKGLYTVNQDPILAGVQRVVFLQTLGSMFQGAASSGDIKMRVTDTSVALVFAGDFLFPSGVTEVSPASFPYLDEVGRAIGLLKLPVRVEGHTDATAGKSLLLNWSISAARAIAVLRYLREGCEVSQAHLSAVGHAHTRPADGQAEALGAQHRRVEIVFDTTLRYGRGE